MTNRRSFFGAIGAMFAPRIFMGEYELARPSADAEPYGSISYLLADRNTFVTFPTYRTADRIITNPHEGSIDKVYPCDKNGVRIT